MYYFRTIICPVCGHKFGYIENTQKMSGYIVYCRQGCDEQLESAFCPECGKEMVILKDSSTGIGISDSSIEISGTVRII